MSHLRRRRRRAVVNRQQNAVYYSHARQPLRRGAARRAGSAAHFGRAAEIRERRGSLAGIALSRSNVASFTVLRRSIALFCDALGRLRFAVATLRCAFLDAGISAASSVIARLSSEASTHLTDQQIIASARTSAKARIGSAHEACLWQQSP